MSNLFPCYSIPLRDFLKSKNIKYELVGIHPETHNMFWVYLKNEDVNKCLTEWKEVKSK